MTIMRPCPIGPVRVVVSTRTEVIEEARDAELNVADVDIERVPVGAEIDVVPDVRTEGDVTIVPVVEERLVIEKRLILVEEIRIRRSTTFRIRRVKADLRKQHVTVERIQKTTKPRR